MIGISKLVCGTVEPSDVLRYGRKSGHLPSHLLQFSEDKKPVVVWNVTKRCNLKCMHCYSASTDCRAENELTTLQGKALIDDLAAFGCPVLLFSGGEPLLREDLLELIEYATGKGLRAVISTNGTLLTADMVEKLKQVKLSYIGISLDGLEKVNDHFRGVTGAFQRALSGIRNCISAGIKVGIRFTINKKNVQDIPGIFELMKAEKVTRACFYHLVYAGRGNALVNDDLSHSESRAVLDQLVVLTKDLYEHNQNIEVLTVDNHCDGPYIYLKMLGENHPRNKDVYQLLQYNEGNSSGKGIGCVSWDGSVHADQFWRHYSFGNVLERPFSKIWTDLSNPIMLRLKNKKDYITGRCSQCQWLSICAGNFRVRAEAATGDLWASDPACYLTDEEIGIEPARRDYASAEKRI